ncbi:MAG: hypothetical protein ACI9N1_000365 [Flavobacteriales bacterium]|jgi:hypothetical protein
MATKKKVPVKTIVSILPDGTITIQKTELAETQTEQVMTKTGAT